MDLAAGVLARIVLCVAVTIVTVLLIWILERNQRPHLGLMLSLGSSMVVGTTLAIFLGVLTLISEFRAMAMRGGGLAVAAAGIWEGTQPLRFALYAGAIAGLFALVTVLRQDTDDRAEAGSGQAAVLIILFVVVFGLAAGSFALYNQVTGTVMMVLDPAEHYREFAAATMSQRISRSLTRTMFTSLAGFILTLVAIPIGLVIGRSVPLSPLRQKGSLFLLALLTLSVLTGAIMTTSWSARLKQIAITGSVPR